MSETIIGICIGALIVGVQVGLYLLAMERLERLTRLEVRLRFERELGR